MLLIPNEKLSTHFDLYQLTQTSQPYDNTPGNEEYEELKRLASVLDMIWERIGEFDIISAFRSSSVNDAVGGAAGSYHTRGMAADLRPRYPMSPEEFWIRIYDDDVIRNSLGEIALKPTNVHVSTIDPPSKKSVPLIQEGGSYRRLAESEIKQIRAGEGITDYTLVYAGAGLAAAVVASLLIYKLRKKK